LAKKRKDFQYQQRLTNVEIGTRLMSIAEGLMKGQLNVAGDGESINLTPTSIGEIELTARQGKSKGFIGIDISWNTKNKQADVVEELVDLAKLDADLFDHLLELAEQVKNGELTEAIEEMQGQETGAKSAGNNGNRKTTVVKPMAKSSKSKTGGQKASSVAKTSAKSASPSRNRPPVKTEPTKTAEETGEVIPVTSGVEELEAATPTEQK
jgi:amphi-Trp domain-containing protein